jgi:hypothetical protein
MKVKIISEFEIGDLDTFDKTNVYDTLNRLEQECSDRYIKALFLNTYDNDDMKNSTLLIYKEELEFAKRFTKNLKVEIE